jgi:hypothetical protein
MTEQNKKDNRGIFSANGGKTKPTHPDYTGTIMIDGIEKRLAIWENKKTDGTSYFSMIASPPLTAEQQAKYKRTDEPQAATDQSSNNTSNNNGNSGNSGKEQSQQDNQDYYNNDFDDELNAILKGSGSDDDNPFN